MSYVDAFYDRLKDKVHVIERVNGRRVIKENRLPNHTFYYERAAGSHKSIYGHSLSKFSTPDIKKFRRELNEKTALHRIFESDINPVFRYLSDNYKDAKIPDLNVCFFDIETDLNVDKRYKDVDYMYAPTDDPYAPITAITMYMSHTKEMISLVLLPETVSTDDGIDICNKFENTYLFDDEAALLEAFLDIFNDNEIDVCSGWNSEQYDIPYTINRIERILGKEATKRLCLFDQFPKPKEYKKFGKLFKSYELVGVSHLDYQILYQKHNPKQQLSYSLDNIGQDEVKESKVPYKGNLDQLYRNDFEKFIEYNRQDVHIMVKIDEKKKFIELSNQIAHANCVLLKTTIGSVTLVEQSIINEMHSLGFIVPNKPPKEFFEDEEDDEDDDEDNPVVGAYVARPKVGLHEMVGCGDVNSLYPSAIRALNMSPETLVGQIRLDFTNALVAERVARGIDRADAWEGIYIALEVEHMLNRDDIELTVDFANHLEDSVNTLTVSAAALNDYIFNPDNNVCVSANGTIFKTDVDGIIPQLLSKWYAERKEYQAKEQNYNKMAVGIEISPELAAQLRELENA